MANFKSLDKKCAYIKKNFPKTGLDYMAVSARVYGLNLEYRIESSDLFYESRKRRVIGTCSDRGTVTMHADHVSVNLLLHEMMHQIFRVNMGTTAPTNVYIFEEMVCDMLALRLEGLLEALESVINYFYTNIKNNIKKG